MTYKLAAILAISLPLLLQPAFAIAQAPASQPRNGQQGEQAESTQFAEFKKTADQLNQAVEKLPEGQAEKEAFQKQLNAIFASLEQIKSDDAQLDEFQKDIESAEKVSNDLANAIEEFKKSKLDTQDLDKLDLLDLPTRKAEVAAGIQDLRNEQATLEEKSTSYQSRKEALDKKLLEIGQQLDVLGQTIANQTDPTSPAEKIALLDSNVQELKLSQRRALITLQKQRQITYRQFDMNTRKLQLVTLKLQRQEEFEEAIDSRIAELRQDEANDLATQASTLAEENKKKFPLLAASEEVNVSLAQNIGQLEGKAAEATEEDRKLKLRLQEIDSKYTTTVSMIEQIRQSNTIGAMLRKRKAELPTAQSREQRAAAARDQVEEIQAVRYQDSEDLSELSIKKIREEVEESSPNVSDEELDKLFEKEGDLHEPALQLIERRKALLRTREKIYDRLFYAYVAIEGTNNSVASLVEKFNNFINERILWLRSSKMLFSDLTIDKADKSLTSVDKWQEITKPALSSIYKRPWLPFIGGLVLLLLLIFRGKMRKEVDALGQKAARGSCATFWPTSRAMVLTTLIAITVPLIVYGIGRLLTQSTPSQSRLFDAIATGLTTAGLFAIPFEILRRTCRPDGLAVKHFNWPGNAVAKLKKHLSWYVFPASALVFAVSMLAKLDTAHRNDLIERTLYLVGILLTALLFYRILSPTDGIFSQYFKRNENSWVNQTKGIWISVIVLIPLALAVLAFTGFYYTALNLTYYLSLTFAFAVALELTRALIRRLVTVRQRESFIESAKRKRKVEIEAAKEARKQAAAERQRRIEAGEDLDDMPPPVPPAEALAELQFDFNEIKVNADHANQLIRLLGLTAWFFGLWMIWGDVLPAMKVLDEYPVFAVATQAAASDDSSAPATMPGMPAAPEADPPKEESAEQADVVSDADSGEVATASTVQGEDFASYRDLLVAIAIVLLTFVAARNLPNAFEMLFLEDLPFDRSARSASKALFSYGIVIFGAALAMRTMSINWTNVQWLVTALTFGLAFGLQEIFANFVAGIILMFERPMRLGDMITVDDFTGFVTRIRTRATTVVNLDRKEYVIPNKDFITGRFTNWTLSDAINRVDVTVGVAYGSDVAKAKKIIFEICKTHPSIVDEPPTQITFSEFADSTLNLVVRTFLSDVLARMPVIDSLHMQINDKFNEAGIEIAFPQQDLHLRSIDEDLAKMLASVRKDNSA